jgi:transposase
MSEQKEKRRYTREFKLETVRLYEASGKSMRTIEQELGITPYLLSKWVQQFRERETAAFPGKGKLPEKDAELQRLRREVEILRQERDILKKVVVIFSEPKR